MKYNIKDQGRDEPKKLSSLKQILSLFKGGGLEELLLKLRGMKQDAEIGIENSKLNAMSLSPGKYNEETQSFDEYTDQDFGRVFDVLDSLGVERSKTDSLLNVLQEKNVEVDSSKIVEDFAQGLFGGGAAGITKKVIQKNLNQKIGGPMAQWAKTFSPETLRLFNADQSFFWNSVRKFERGIDASDPNYVLSKKAFDFYNKFLKK